MTAPRKSILTVAALLAVGLTLGLKWWYAIPPESGKPPAPGSIPVTGTAPLPPAPAPDPIPAVLEQLGSKPGPVDAAAALSHLRAALAALPPDEAVRSIREFLRSGTDRPTGLSFEIAAGGSLKESPTLRTFLLNLLPEIDPAAAAEISRAILQHPTTADEWALALRNVGRFEESPATTAFLKEKTLELIAHPAWQAQPSIGYLNAFDVLVYTRAVDTTPVLSTLIQRKDRQDLAHAAFLTLDRLVQLDPVDVLTRLAADPALGASRPEMTAQQFARADLRDPAQQAIVKTWLLDPARTGTELRSFAGVYPNHNAFVSHNLLTEGSPPPPVDLRLHDAAVAELIHGWSLDPAFQPILPHLNAISARMKAFTASTQAGKGSGP